jgi:Zn-dependent protease with chaperone function
MIYNNLLYFMVAIFVFSSIPAAVTPWLPAWGIIVLMAFLLFAFYSLAGRSFAKCYSGSSCYFRAEKRLSVLALFLYCGAVFTLDLKYYLQPLSLDNRLPVLENFAGLSLFFVVLAAMWIQARPVYERVFHRSFSAKDFVVSQVKTNLPIVLPWLILSLAFDLLALLPLPAFQRFLLSPWGDLFFFAVFLLFLTLFFPPVIRRLWNCRPLEDGVLRRSIEAFCSRNNFSADILYWPLFEGQVLTAAIMGIFPGFRYLLVTKSLLATLERDELESVVAHEIGHVKMVHLGLYALLFLGFSVVAGMAAEPLAVYLLSSNWFYTILGWLQVSPEAMLGLLSSIPVLVLLVLYFRFLFGYFMRNFERQADLYVFKAQGTSRFLVSSFEKIASLSGNIRDKKSWHHFGIGERIDFLEKCEKNPSLRRLHSIKVYTSLALYCLVIVCSASVLYRVNIQQVKSEFAEKYSRAVLNYQLTHPPQSGSGLQQLGELLLENQMEQKAVAVFTEALALQPDNPVLANNLSWLLLTSKEVSLRDPVRALDLAYKAAGKNDAGFVLDTLATALWANKRVDEALNVEKRAIRKDPAHQKYYRSQMEKFVRKSWNKALTPLAGQ